MEAVVGVASTVKVPTPTDRVFKDECMFSFDTPESPSGLYTSLTTWQSFGAHHVMADFERNANPLYLKRQWRRIAKPLERVNADHSPATAPSKMAIGVKGGFDVNAKPYDVEKSAYLVCMPDAETEIPVDGSADLPEIVSVALQAFEKHQGVARATQLAAAWEEEGRKESKYATGLPQLDTGKKISPNPAMWKCEESGLTDNLWLNLSTGYIGSGRKMWDGSGGTGAALRHFEETGKQYPLCVKLGTITPHGADVYSYAPDEDDMVLDPKLAEHLAHWGINMQLLKKSEKTMAELQIDLNMSYEFDKITESGSNLVPLAGPGFIGLENLGNSCYMSSILQLVSGLPEVKARYLQNATRIYATSGDDPSQDLIAMLSKVVVGLQGDRYARPIPVFPRELDSGDKLAGDGKEAGTQVQAAPSSIRPQMFKSLIGHGHPEFGSERQQDAGEFFQYFLEKLSRAERTGGDRLSEDSNSSWASSSLFAFQVEDRLSCDQSNKVRYVSRAENVLSLAIPVSAATNADLVKEYESRREEAQKTDNYVDIGKTEAATAGREEPVKLHVPFAACLEHVSAEETISDFYSPATGKPGTAHKRTRLRTFPDYLMVQLARYYVAEDWTPKKLDVNVPVPVELDLECLRGRGLVEGEELLPEDDAPGTNTAEEPTLTKPDDAIVAQVVGMGFSENGAKRAAIATENAGADACMEWVFAHMDDPDFNDPLPEQTASGARAPHSASSEPSTESVNTLSAMGFTAEQATAALLATEGSLERAADWLFSHADNLDEAIAAENNKRSGPSDEAPTGPPKEGIFSDGSSKYELIGFASHLGSNTGSGHYVCHKRDGNRFVLYNDSKVAISKDPPLGFGFLYMFKRKA